MIQSKDLAIKHPSLGKWNLICIGITTVNLLIGVTNLFIHVDIKLINKMLYIWIILINLQLIFITIDLLIKLTMENLITFWN